MQEQNNFSSRIDFGLVTILLLLCVTSLGAIFSAQSTGQYTENFLIKQIIWYMVGIGIIFGVITLDSDQLKKISWYAYGFGIFLLLSLVILPTSIVPEINGARSWFKIPGVGSIQPSEFMKVFLILALANVIATHHVKNPVKTIETDLWLLGKLGFVTAVPLLLIMQQPDLGTSLVLCAILVGMVFISGISWKILLSIFSGVTLLISTIFYFILFQPDLLKKYLGVKEYQFGRIYSWIDPYNYSTAEGFHLIKSLLAIGSGQTTGKGLENEKYICLKARRILFLV